MTDNFNGSEDNLQQSFSDFFVFASNCGGFFYVVARHITVNHKPKGSLWMFKQTSY